MAIMARTKPAEAAGQEAGESTLRLLSSSAERDGALNGVFH